MLMPLLGLVSAPFKGVRRYDNLLVMAGDLSTSFRRKNTVGTTLEMTLDAE